MSEPEKVVFDCTPSGVIASGRSRLARVFAVLALALFMATAFALATGQVVAGLLTLLLSFGVFVIYRMSKELDPTELVLEPDSLTILMRHALRRLPLQNASARRLTEDEIGHLANLASSGGFVAGTGGFDSHRLGEFDLYASRLDCAVLLETMDGRVIVTPDRPGAFTEEIARRAASAAALDPLL